MRPTVGQLRESAALWLEAARNAREQAAFLEAHGRGPLVGDLARSLRAEAPRMVLLARQALNGIRQWHGGRMLP